MLERTVTVAIDVGLHARPAAMFVQKAATSDREVNVAKTEEGRRVNAKSILAVLGLDVRQGDEVVIGSEDAAIVDDLARMVGRDISESAG